jgi:hypothetical protein
MADAERARNHDRAMARAENDAAVERRRNYAMATRAAEAPPLQPSPEGAAEAAARSGAAPAASDAPPAPPAVEPAALSVFSRRAAEAHAAEVQRRREHRRVEEAKNEARAARASGRQSTATATFGLDELVVGSGAVQPSVSAALRAPRSAPLASPRAARPGGRLRSRTPGEAPRDHGALYVGLEIGGSTRSTHGHRSCAVRAGHNASAV